MAGLTPPPLHVPGPGVYPLPFPLPLSPSPIHPPLVHVNGVYVLELRPVFPIPLPLPSLSFALAYR